MTEAIENETPISPGEIYEDCAFHPVLCVESNVDEDFVRGVSLIDGTHPHECSLRHCGVRRMTLDEAWDVKLNGPREADAREAIAPDERWWVPGPDVG